LFYERAGTKRFRGNGPPQHIFLREGGKKVKKKKGGIEEQRNVKSLLGSNPTEKTKRNGWRIMWNGGELKARCDISLPEGKRMGGGEGKFEDQKAQVGKKESLISKCDSAPNEGGGKTTTKQVQWGFVIELKRGRQGLEKKVSS